MYHINSDKRTLVSATMIYDGLIELINEGNNVYKITVSDIQKKSSVSRSTFYRLFDEPIDVLIWQCDCYHEKLFQECHNEMSCSYNKYKCIETFFNNWQKKIDLLELLIKIHRTDIIYYSFIDKYHIITDNYSSVEEFKKNPRLFTALRSSIALSTLIYWIESGKTLSSKDLLDYILGELQFISQTEVFF